MNSTSAGIGSERPSLSTVTMVPFLACRGVWTDTSGSTRRYLDTRIVLLLAAVAASCATGGTGAAGVQLRPSKPPGVTELNNALALTDVTYIDDITYRKDPRLLLGKIATIRKPANGACTPEDPSGRIFFVGRVTPLKWTEASTPEVSKSIVVDKTLGAGASFLGFLSLQLDDQHVSSVTVTDQVQRVDDGDNTYVSSFASFKADNDALFQDQNICWILQVDGYTHKTIVSKVFEKTTAGAQSGAYGVKVGANYFSSNENNDLFHRFGLSVTVRRRPSGLYLGGVGRKPTVQEAEMLSHVTGIEDATKANK